MDDFQDDELEDHRTGFSKETYHNQQLKIKKVRRGKIIWFSYLIYRETIKFTSIYFYCLL